MEAKPKDDIRIKTIISNVIYVLKYAMDVDKKTVLGYIFLNSAHRVISVLVQIVSIRISLNMIINGAPFNDILKFMTVVAAIGIAECLTGVGTEQWMETRIIRATAEIQRRFVKKSADIDLICYDRPEYYDDFVIAASQADEMIRQSVTCVSAIIGDSLAILSCAALIITINPILALFPVAGFIINITTRIKIQKLEYEYDMKKKIINRKADYSKRVFYQPEFAKEIKLTDIEISLKNQFLDAIDEEKKMAAKYGFGIAALSLVNWTFSFTFFRFFCVPVYLGYLAIVRRIVGLGDVAALNNAAETIQWRLDQMNYALIEFQKVGQYAHRFKRFLEYEENLETFIGERQVPLDNGSIEIKNMSFKYDGCDEYTLKDINMSVRKGERIAIVGENGAGKTTFIKLLMRLYEVTDGEIKFGGNNIKRYTTKEYREKIAAVFQEYQLYGASLSENVKMDIVADSDENKLLWALSFSDFTSKLEKLPDGLNTAVTKEFSDNGTLFSGGESQKIAIARMFAARSFASDKKPLLAILDEPSSALDPKAEYILNTNIMEKAGDSTVIFISHRLSTTRSADRIYLFEKGGITEQGTHEELMALGGSYANMFEKQAKYYKLTVNT